MNNERLQHELNLAGGVMMWPTLIFDAANACPPECLADPTLAAVYRVARDLSLADVCPSKDAVFAALAERGMLASLDAELLDRVQAGASKAEIATAATAIRLEHDRQRHRALAEGVAQDLTSAPAEVAPAIWRRFIDDALRQSVGGDEVVSHDLAALLLETADTAERRHRGEVDSTVWPLGVTAVDSAFKLHPEVVFVLGAPSGGGKTTFSLWLALQHAQNHPRNAVLYAPFADINERDLAVRAASNLADVDSWRVGLGRPHEEHVQALHREARRAQGWLKDRFTVCPSPPKEVERLVSYIRRWVLEKRAKGFTPSVVVLDYVQRIKTTSGAKGLDLLEVVCETVKEQIAKAFGIAVLIPSQYNREYARALGAKPRPPITADLFGGSVIEHFADIIGMIHPTELAWPDGFQKPDKTTPEGRRLIGLRRFELHLRKNRRGKMGRVALIADMSVARYWPEGSCPLIDGAKQLGMGGWSR